MPILSAKQFQCTKCGETEFEERAIRSIPLPVHRKTPGIMSRPVQTEIIRYSYICLACGNEHNL